MWDHSVSFTGMFLYMKRMIGCVKIRHDTNIIPASYIVPKQTVQVADVLSRLSRWQMS